MLKMIRKRYLVGLALLVGVLYVLLIALAPEVGCGPLRGPRLLNTEGFGYELADVVWVAGPTGGYATGDVVLYDWVGFDRSMNEAPGFGPPYALRQVLACPQDVIEIQHDQIIVDDQITPGNPHDSLFRRLGMPTQGKYALPPGVYLLCDNTRPILTPVKEEFIHAAIRCKIGKNYYKARQLRNTVY